MSAYPAGAIERDRFILERRPPRPAHDPWRAHGVIVEDERIADGTPARVATVFLTGRECPWRCLMCDLWQFSTTDGTPHGALPIQVADARRKIDQLGGVTRAKLYNAGSFFDPRAVPESDYDAVAASLRGLAGLIVESHPTLVGSRTERWLDSMARHAGLAAPALEVAMGLETTHPDALARLHKGMTLDTFAEAAGRLQVMGVGLRVFLLVSVPFIPIDQQVAWLRRSVAVAWQCGAGVVSLIPTRPGNGALDAIAAEGHFAAPSIDDLERAHETTLAMPRPAGARVFADTWDLERFATCPHCLPRRRARMQTMNLEQRILPRVPCTHDPEPGSR